MDGQKRSSGVTRGLASPANQTAAAATSEAKIPLVIVSEPSQASLVPAELIGIAVDYDPATIPTTTPEACHTSGNITGPEEAEHEPIFRLAESDEDDETGNDHRVSAGTRLSEATTAVNSVVEKTTKVDKLDHKWLSATPPSVASPVLEAAKAKAKANENDLWVSRTPVRTIALEFNDVSGANADNSPPASLKPPSIWRGPVLRHDRLQHSETMASTRRVMDPMDEERQSAEEKMKIRKGQVAIIYSYLLLLLSSVAFAVLTTIETLYKSGSLPVLEDETGIVVGLVITGLSIVIAIGCSILSTKKHRKNRENPTNSGRNSWIELQHRENKPLPPLPSIEKNAADENDPKVRAAFEKFIKDKDRLRRYLYGLEEIILRANGGDRNANPDFMVVHDIMASVQPQSTTTGRATESTTPVRRRARLSPVRIFSGNTDKNHHNESDPEATAAPKASTSGKKTVVTKHAAKDSISKDNLLQNDSAEASVPHSDTNASILGELCDAVMEPVPKFHHPLSVVGGSVGNDDNTVTTSRCSSREQSPATGSSNNNNATGQKRWSRRGYANLTDVPEPQADPYNSENYRRKGKGRAD